MSDLIVGSSLHRALNRYGIPNRITVDEKHLVVEELRVTTDRFDTDESKLPLLGKMTEWEMKLFRRAGFDEVVRFRRWEARETYRLEDWREVGRTRYTTKATPDQQPMAGTKPIAPHRREDTGEECRCGLIDMEAAYYSCPYVNAGERRRRMAARDFADALPAIKTKLREIDARQVREVQAGTGPDPVQGTEAGSEEQANRTPERVSVLPSQDRQGDRATADDQGRDTADPGSGSGIRSSERPATAGSEGIRARLRPVEELGRQTPVETEPMAVAPELLPGVPEKDRQERETGVTAGMEAPRTVNKSGRPRSTRTAEEIREANRRKAQAYRARKREQG